MRRFAIRSWLGIAISLNTLAAASVLPAATLHWTPVNEPGVGGQITCVEVDPTNSAHLVMAGDMLGATVSWDGGRTWQGTYGFKSWEDADATFSPDGKTLWLGTMAGPYVSTDGGVHWTEKRVGLPDSQWGKYAVPVQKVLFVPDRPGHLLAFGGSHRHWSDGRTLNFGCVWESVDSGEHWTKKSVVGADSAGNGGNVVQAFFVPGSATRLYAAVNGRGVYKSLDTGATWTALNTGLPNTYVNGLTESTRSPQNLWAALGGGVGIYKTTDGGTTWQAASQGLDGIGSGADYPSVAVAADGKSLYTGCYNAGQAYQSLDGGATWHKLAVDCPRAYSLGVQGEWVTTDPQDARRVLICNSVTLFASQDAGKSWTDMTASPSPQNPDLWRGRGYSGLVSQNFAWNPFNTREAVAQAMDDGKFLISRDNLQTWQRNGAGMNAWNGGSEVAFSGPSGHTVYAALGMQNGGDGLGKSVDGGKTWTYAAMPDGASHQVTSVYAQPNDPNQVWMVAGSKLYRSTDGGGHWTAVSLNDGGIYHVVGDSLTTKAAAIYAVGQSGVYKSADGGATFVQMPGSPVNWGYGSSTISIDPNDPTRLYVCNWGFSNPWNTGVWQYAAGKWNLISSDHDGPIRRACQVAVDPADAACIAVVTNDNPWSDISAGSGVWLTQDGGKTWTAQNDGLPMLRGAAIRFSPDKSGLLVVGLNGRGFYKATVKAAAIATAETH